MGRTRYHHNVTLEYGEEKIERTVKARNKKEAMKIVKDMLIDKEFEKVHDYKLTAMMKPMEWNNGKTTTSSY